MTQNKMSKNRDASKCPMMLPKAKDEARLQEAHPFPSKRAHQCRELLSLPLQLEDAEFSFRFQFLEITIL